MPPFTIRTTTVFQHPHQRIPSILISVDVVPPPTSSSVFSENESADVAHSGLGVPFRAQQEEHSGYGRFDTNNLPHSPIPDSAHPWDEVQQQSFGPTSAETIPKSHQSSTSRHRCDICKNSFASNTGLKRHVETTHEYGRTYWVCTVKSCGKYDRPVFRRDNFRRHCKTKHPTVDLEQFGL
ncbi:uncharacterized protein BKA55DRAFT_584194 [Fusarium redolens]|uniref:C2H2-type domain-containing protein n=1 Tax=Fusarium redolens TaxID=48865 RepID=A0A9P9FZ66_FUSRE|nr:uncharacterized protein BKA55DRAFT_584194 [Fusarium redolens]KAH7227144.1 hypothetical protein BKA55DRAFT_584194 [Fusarium redolens]